MGRQRDLVQAHRHPDQREPDAVVIAIILHPDPASGEPIAEITIIDDDLD
jgi:hypothetical protein